MNETRRPRLLSIDDEYGMREVIIGIGEAAGYEAYGSYGRQVDAALSADPDVIVLDMNMPDLDGIEVIWKLAAQNSKAAIIILSGFDEESIRIANIIANKRGLNVVDSLRKPVNHRALTEKLVALKAGPHQGH